MKIAVIETGGKQYKVFVGQKIKIEKLEKEIGSEISFDKVLLIAEQRGFKADNADKSGQRSPQMSAESAEWKVEVGAPYVDGVKVQAKVLNQERHDKLIVFKYHSKTRRRKKKGHRQYFTELEIVSIK